MLVLYHFWLSPFARKIRLALAEKGVPFELRLEREVERRPEFLALNPAGEVPVLVDEDETVVADSAAICEYLEETRPDLPLLGATAAQRAETRRLVGWFDGKFNREVTENLVGEKLMKRLNSQGYPHAPAIRAGLANIHYHLDYIAYLAERRTWLAGDDFSLADIAAGAHLSTVDYLGDVPWDEHPEARLWYARIKSRPSFRALLADSVPGAPPPPHYANLDF
ncbi:glutathione S-transferase family protein [Arenibaculum sp.]|uniref:glutathione S-transferase family protein n=1 Tax=Arenibaculum sp. TaxID=2865862 RepID=UPI002E0E96C6|nr:glutathione S-transferase family protein [Arenibaculum sp.]